MADPKDKSSSSSVVPKTVKVILGSVSGMCTTLFTHPMDVIKNRMQLAGASRRGRKRLSARETLRNLLRQEGMLSFYAGLSAALLRQATYTTTRLGVYTWLFDVFSDADGNPPDLATKTAIGMVAGLAGAFAGTPSEVALVRMTGDGQLPPHLRRSYNNIFDAIYRIRKEEGIRTLWRGGLPTMGRSMIVNVAQLVSYSEAKERLQHSYFKEDGIPLQISAGLISGLLQTVASMPMDIIKTRLQNMHGIQYKGSIDVLLKVVRREGFFALWNGFVPCYAKQAPSTVLMFIFLEKLNICYIKHFLGIDTT